MRQPLNGTELMNFMDGKTTVLTYKDLKNYNTLDSVFGDYDNFILLYETSTNRGHWTIVIKHKKTVEHFDSYGLKPDYELDYINMTFREENNEKFSYLSWLYYTSPYTVVYNDFKFQEMSADINTCGRHCIQRYRCKGMNIDKYINFMKKLKKEFQISFDEIVSLLVK